MAKAEEFVTGHHDRVTVLHTSFNGSRILTGSIDHRIKVWDRNPKTGERTLVDTFTAHDSDIRDAKFLHPTLGSYIASIGNDLKFHLWTEDASQAPNNGHRFRRIATIPSTPRVPFVSLDLKTAADNITTYLALIDRQGLLSVYEPSNPDDLKDWTLIDQFNVCGSNAPSRGDETSFKVRFDPNVTPLAYTNSVSDERGQLSLVVSALNDIKVYRSTVPSASPSSGPGSLVGSSIGGAEGLAGTAGFTPSDGASHRLMFYEAAKLPRHPALVRDVAWAPFSVRGTDRIATACKDGSVRVFELAVLENTSSAASSATGAMSGTAHGKGAATSESTKSAASQSMLSTSSSTTSRSLGAQQRQQPQSSLTSAITGRSQPQPQLQSQQQHPGHSPTPSTSTSFSQSQSQSHSSQSHLPPQPLPNQQQQQQQQQQYPSVTFRTGHAFPFQTTLSSAAALAHAHPDAWSLSFDGQGQVLLTNGSDGVTKIWRKSVMDGGQWLVFAGQEVRDGRRDGERAQRQGENDDDDGGDGGDGDGDSSSGDDGDE